MTHGAIQQKQERRSFYIEIYSVCDALGLVAGEGVAAVDTICSLLFSICRFFSSVLLNCIQKVVVATVGQHLKGGGGDQNKRTQKKTGRSISRTIWTEIICSSSAHNPTSAGPDFNAASPGCVTHDLYHHQHVVMTLSCMQCGALSQLNWCKDAKIPLQLSRFI